MKNDEQEMVTITKDEYRELLESHKLLQALQWGGVDNWEGYDSTLEVMESMEHGDK